MSLSALIWGQSQFDEAIDKATSELRLGEEDIALNLEICDQIRSKSVPPKDAARALKRRLNHKNPNVKLLALGLTDVCVKNGGDHFLAEIASKEFMDNLVSILHTKDLNYEVKNKMLRLIQNWSVAFEGKYTLGYVGQVYKELKSSGFSFPPKDLTVANSAMIDTSTAPEWIDSDVCLKCRDPFTFINRKHHCRNCGGVYDHRCSSKTMPLPHFGISQEVRVCDGCHIKLTKSGREKERPVDFSRNASHRRQESISRKRRSVRDFSDADIQRAIQLSLQDAPSPSPSPKHSTWETSEPPLFDRNTRPLERSRADEENDEELQAAIRASLREANAPRPSAPLTSPSEEYNGYSSRKDAIYDQERYSNRTPRPRSQPPLPSLPNHDLDLSESDAILTFNQTVQDARSQGGSDLSRIPNVHELYNHASILRPKLALSLDETGRKEEMLSEMHGKLSEAVKLYDKILTEQLARPKWRASTLPQPYGHDQQTQWSAPRMSSPIQDHNYVLTGPPAPVMSTRPQNSTSESLYVASQTAADPSYQHQANVYHNSEYYPNPPYQQVTSPVSVLPQTNSLQSSGQLGQPASPPQGRWSPPRNEQYQSIHGTLGTIAPPVSQPYSQFQPQQIPASPAPLPTQHVYSPVPEQSQAQQYPPSVVQQHQESSPPVMPTLSRHNTLSQALLPATVASPAQTATPSTNAAQYYHTSASQSQSNHMPPELPSFPIAPTSNPISLSMYSPPTGFEQPEQKEVLLIDL